jgi:hypothetical protein
MPSRLSRARPVLALVLLACHNNASNEGCQPPLQRLHATDAAALAPGNESGQDEDPAVLLTRNPDALYVAWYSSRLGTHTDGLARKEIFVTRSTDGSTWTAPQAATDSHAWSFYPALAREASGVFHLAWMRWQLLPQGCIYFDSAHCPGDQGCCTGFDSRIYQNASFDGLAFSETTALQISPGPADEMPSLLVASDGRLLLYFTSGYRGGDTQWRLSVAVRDAAGWHPPVLLAGIESPQNDTFPHVVERAPGSFLMTFTRYDRAQGANAFDPSAETMLSTSADGLTWTPARVVSGPSLTKTDVLPWLYAEQSGSAWSVLWVNEDGVVSLPIDGRFPQDLKPLDIPGYSPRLLPTPTPGLDWAVWVAGTDPLQQIQYRFQLR